MGTTSSSLDSMRVIGITVGIITSFFAVVAALVWNSGVHKRIQIMFSLPTAIALMCHYILQYEDVSAFLRIDAISFEQTFWVLVMAWAFIDGICLSLSLWTSKITGSFLATSGAGAAFLFLVAGRASDYDVRWCFFSFGIIAVAFNIIVSLLGSRAYGRYNVDENGEVQETPLQYRTFEYVWVFITHALYFAVFIGAILTLGLAPEGGNKISGPKRDIGYFVVSLGMIGSHVVKIAQFRDHSVRSE